MASTNTPPPWLTIAMGYLGFHESGNNQGIEHFIQSAHTGSLGDPWCAIFVNACLEEAGIKGTRSAAARSFENNANFQRLAAPIYGCIVTRWRQSQSSGLGHVYFYLGESGDGILALAGNEDDAVRKYTESKDPVTGYWWPVGYPQAGAMPPAGTNITETGGAWLSGKGSWYSQYQGKYSWVDTGDRPNSNALGVPDDQQGIALYTRTTLGNWFDVTAPNGVTLRLRHSDVGPHPSTGRSIDIAAVAAEKFGYTPKNFPTDGIFKWKSASAMEPVPVPDTAPAPTVPTVDYDAIAAAVAAKLQPKVTKSLSAILAAVMGALPQTGLWGLLATVVLNSFGVLGPAIGASATATGTTATATFGTMLLSGLLSLASKAFQKPTQGKMT